MKVMAASLLWLFLVCACQGQAPKAQEPVPAEIGLAIGQPAPAFTLTDQFGQQQSTETLRSPSGTVLLFFRSSDW